MTAWLPVGLRHCAKSTHVVRRSCPNSFVLAIRPTIPSRELTTTTSKRLPVRDAAYTEAVHSSEVDEAIANLPPIKAASEIEFPEGKEGDKKPDIEDDEIIGLPEITARLVPISPSFFTGSPVFTDNLLHLRSVLRKYATVPTVKPGEQPRVVWRDVLEYRSMVGEGVGNAKYHKIVEVLQRLNQINPALMPPEVTQTLEPYKRDVDPRENKAKPIPIDRFGRALGVGRRKASNARAWVVEGTGEVLVNGKPLNQAFARVHDRESVLWALKATHRIDKYNVWALCEGGGTTGQAEALTLAVAKALLTHEPLLKPALRRAGVVTRDPRRVERKKPGHLKARKMPQWVKR